ncbi:MAG: PPK2 family polyphosphate kinase [Cyclobacteriaceae bacterium]
MKNILKEIKTIPPEKLEKDEVKKQNKKMFAEIASHQDTMYAQADKSLLIIFQGLDASGKNSATKKIFRTINPMGLRVKGFSQPTEIELQHDFLWRIHQHTPRKGMIQIFNRSHYEDVTVTRVKDIIDDETAENRFAHINHFEDLLKSNGTTVLKFYLHVSEEEQKKRLKERLMRPDKHWKFSEDDFLSTQHREEFLDYYQQVFDKCSEPFPWTIVPADKKWYARNIIAHQVLQTMKKLPLKYPDLKE